MRSLIVAGLILAACQPGTVTPSPTATAEAAVATTPGPSPTPTPRPVWPLRGTQAANADEIKRRPVVVKLGNDVTSRPQSGLKEADAVFELEAEFGITRLAVVFHSQDSDRIGPVRSGRLSDLEISPMLKAILAHVGAEPQTLDRIREASRRGDLVDVDEFTHAGAFERVRDRPAPFNTFTSTRRLRDAAKDTAKVDVPAFLFGESKASGAAATTLTLKYTAPEMEVTYELAGEAFKRTQGSRATDVQPANVVVIKTEIREGHLVDEFGSRAHEVRSTGDGPLIVLSAGKRYEGKWTRQSGEAFRFADTSGAEIRLRPGLTWIHIVPLTFEAT